MPLLRKKPVADEAEPDPLVKVSGKGRPTPSRKQAQAARRSPARQAVARAGKAGDPKSAKQAMREARRAKAAEYRAAMNSGDISKLPARERVPERVMARDIVDQRRNLGPLLLALIVVAYFAGLAPGRGIKAIAVFALPVLLICIVIDSVIVGRLVTRQIAERHPDTRVKVKGYVAQRALLPARWRQPRPRPGITIGRWIPRR